MLLGLCTCKLANTVTKCSLVYNFSYEKKLSFTNTTPWIRCENNRKK